MHAQIHLWAPLVGGCSRVRARLPTVFIGKVLTRVKITVIIVALKCKRVIYGGYKIKRPIHNKLAHTLELCALIYGLSKEQWLINSYDNFCRLIKDDARKCLGYVIE